MKGTTKCSTGGIFDLDDQLAERSTAPRRANCRVGQVVTIHSNVSSRPELYEIVKLDAAGIAATLRPLGAYSINGRSTSLVEVDVFCLRPWDKPTTTEKICRYCHTSQPLENFRQGMKCRRCEAREQQKRHRTGYVSLRARMNEELRKAG